jgi:hypothetical protein
MPSTRTKFLLYVTDFMFQSGMAGVEEQHVSESEKEQPDITGEPKCIGWVILCHCLWLDSVTTGWQDDKKVTNWKGRMVSSGMLRRVTLVRTDVSEEEILSYSISSQRASVASYG